MSLNELMVSNLIFMDTLHLNFSSGFNIITGETGAGKSLLLGALSLVLGQKVSPRAFIRHGTSQASVTAVFSAPSSDKFEHCLESLGITCNNEVIMRRTLYHSNTSKCWINDQPVTLKTLQQTGEMLVDIHGQNQHQTFLKKHIHLQLLDILGEHKGDLTRYREAYQKLNELKKKYQELSHNQEARFQKLEMLQFQDNEISRYNLEPGRDEVLEKERNILKNALELKSQASELMEVLYNGEHSVYSMLSQVCNLMDNFSEATAHPSLAENFNSLLTLSEELFRDINSVEEKIEMDPEKLNETEEELNQLYHLKRKYGHTIEEILSYQEKIRGEIEELNKLDISLETIEQDISDCQHILEKTACNITQKRKDTAKQLQKKVNRELQFLGFNNPLFIIQFHEKNDYGPYGKEEVEFHISTNPDRKPQPLKEVASGGEISRIMLALKTVFARADQIPSMVFDEVDTGIGSVTAHKVGEALKKLSANHQVICITHLPQIATKADYHLVVDKYYKEGKTCINVRKIKSKKEKEEEITRLLGLDDKTETSRKIARDLLNEFHTKTGQ